jgi:hypothetical protein
VVDWSSTISGQVTDETTPASTLTLAEVIERITRDLKTQAEDASYRVGDVTNGAPQDHSPFAREVMAEPLGRIVAALGRKLLGA